jgi:ABC-type polysaccharide/polyol phosphate export permease
VRREKQIMNSPEPPADESGPEEHWQFSASQNWRRIRERRETLRFLISANLRAGHRDKLLGNLWNLLDPLLFLGVYFLVFGIGLRQAQGDPLGFVVYLSIGVLAFRFFEGCVSQASVCVRSNTGLLHSVYFPKAMLPIAVCFSRLYDFLWGLSILLTVMWLGLGFSFSIQILWLPLIVLLQFLLCLGFAFVVAYLGSIFADTQNIVAIGTRLLFFLSPIFYFARSRGDHEGIIPEQYLFFYDLNPVARLLDAYRDAMLWGTAPTTETFLYLGGMVFVALVLGFWLFSRAEGRFAKYL